MHITKEEKVVGIFQKFRNDFQEFAFNNKIVVSATGLVFGLATKNFIDNVLNNIVLPLILKSSNFILINNLPKNLKSYTGSFQIFGTLIWDIFMWFTTIILTFVILEYFFNRTFLGLQTKLTADTKKEFIKAKEKEDIIPDDKQIKKIVKESKEESIETKKIANNDVTEYDKDFIQEKKNLTEDNKKKPETFIDSYNTNDNMHMIGNSFTLL